MVAQSTVKLDTGLTASTSKFKAKTGTLMAVSSLRSGKNSSTKPKLDTGVKNTTSTKPTKPTQPTQPNKRAAAATTAKPKATTPTTSAGRAGFPRKPQIETTSTKRGVGFPGHGKNIFPPPRRDASVFHRIKVGRDPTPPIALSSSKKLELVSKSSRPRLEPAPVTTKPRTTPTRLAAGKLHSAVTKLTAKQNLETATTANAKSKQDLKYKNAKSNPAFKKSGAKKGGVDAIAAALAYLAKQKEEAQKQKAEEEAAEAVAVLDDLTGSLGRLHSKLTMELEELEDRKSLAEGLATLEEESILSLRLSTSRGSIIREAVKKSLRLNGADGGTVISIV